MSLLLSTVKETPYTYTSLSSSSLAASMPKAVTPATLYLSVLTPHRYKPSIPVLVCKCPKGSPSNTEMEIIVLMCGGAGARPVCIALQNPFPCI